MTTRPISTLLRTSGQLLARITGRGERPAERVKHLFFPAAPAPVETVASRIAQASAGQAPRKSRAPAGGPTVEGRRHTVANLALRRTGVLPPEARVPQAATSPAAPSRSTPVAAMATATREIPKPSSSHSAPRANSAFLSHRSIAHAFPRINVTPQDSKSPVRRGNTGRFARLQPSFEQGSVATPDSLERTLRFQPVRTAPMQNWAPAQKTLRWTGKITFSLAALLSFTFTAAAHADSRPDFNRDAKPLLRSQPQLLHYVKVHFDVQETGYARSPGDESHAPAPPYIFRAKPLGASGPYTITLFIQPGAPGHILYVKKTGPLAAENNPPASAYPPGENPASFNPSGEPPASTSASSNEASAPSTPATPNGFVGVDSSTPSGPIKPSTNATAPDLAPPPETAPAR
jgi:hypothetical protein